MTARRLARRLRCSRGQSLVESALSLGIVIAVLIGIIELTIALYCYNYVAYAAREATRWAMVRGSTCTRRSWPLTLKVISAMAILPSPLRLWPPAPFPV